MIVVAILVIVSIISVPSEWIDRPLTHFEQSSFKLSGANEGDNNRRLVSTMIFHLKVGFDLLRNQLTLCCSQ